MVLSDSSALDLSSDLCRPRYSWVKRGHRLPLPRRCLMKCFMSSPHRRNSEIAYSPLLSFATALELVQ